MSDDVIRYDLLVQDALRSVVRKVLADAAHNGLPGEHHFYITFRTDARGVRLSNRMRERYPEEMTIILQHQFWDLSVTDQAFEVGLSFSGVSEKLLIPFDAVVGFSDPSVEFGLKFAVQEPEPEVGANDVAPAKRPSTKPAAKLPPSIADKPPRGAGSEPAETKPTSQPKIAPAAKGRVGDKVASKDDDKETKSSEAKVVSIDAFRKKT
jgi:hypothetical protein